jgi:hypothetical protein
VVVPGAKIVDLYVISEGDEAMGTALRNEEGDPIVCAEPPGLPVAIGG